MARETLQSFITEFCSDLSIIGQASNVPEAIKQIAKEKPDLLFLDIEMPKISGLELLSFFEADEIDFQIIFTTAYSQYAVDAFRLSAIDYLLKPINIEDLQEAVEKAKSQKLLSKEAVKSLQMNLQSNRIKRLGLPSLNGYDFFDVSEIIFLQAEGAYTNVHLSNNQVITVSKNLGDIERLEQYEHFFKPHRSFMINLNEIKQYHRNDGGYIIMNGGGKVSLSKRKKIEFFELLQQFHVI